MFTNSIKSKILALFTFSSVLAPFIAINPTATIAATPNKLEVSKVSDKNLYAQNVNNNGIKPLNPIAKGNGKAMTWKILQGPLYLDSKSFVYILFGSDTGKPGGTNPYTGDTNINEYRSLLCIKKTGIPRPKRLPPAKVSPGGATTRSWSGGRVLIIPNVQGKQLTSQAVADGMCEKAGQRKRGTSGYRMAEFHDGNGKNAGWSFWAQAFYRDVQDLKPKTRFWVNINDQPNATPWGSMVGDDIPSSSIARFKVSYGGASRFERLIRESFDKRGYPLELLRFEDFNGDGKTDILTEFGGRFQVSYGGTSAWKPLIRATKIPLKRVRFGDFNGDGKTDLFTTLNGRFYVSYGGTSAWQPLLLAKPYYGEIPLEKLYFGDFNGDGKTDVFTTFNGRFQVSYGGISRWKPLAGTNIPLERFRLGDFNGDGKTDVFTVFGGRFQVSYGGTSRWKPLAKTRIPLKRLRFGDFNGDGKTDVFTTFKLGVGGSGFQVSYGGTSRWKPLLRTRIPLERLRFGDFNGDGKTDVFI
ncbi:MAG: VCBS repeat-containing protein [Cyanobacteria bacterium P01_A01_bin.68]